MTAAVFEEIRDLVPHEQHREIHDRLLDSFVRNGACWTTDEEREALGFESRDNKGWTLNEKIEREVKMREAMMAMMSTIVPIST